MKTEKSENEERNDERNEEEKKWERDREEKRKVKEKKETNAKEKRESDPLISNSFRKLQLPANRKRSVSRWDEILFQNEEKKEKTFVTPRFYGSQEASVSPGKGTRKSPRADASPPPRRRTFTLWIPRLCNSPA